MSVLLVWFIPHSTYIQLSIHVLFSIFCVLVVVECRIRVSTCCALEGVTGVRLWMTRSWDSGWFHLREVVSTSLQRTPCSARPISLFLSVGSTSGSTLSEYRVRLFPNLFDKSARAGYLKIAQTELGCFPLFSSQLERAERYMTMPVESTLIYPRVIDETYTHDVFRRLPRGGGRGGGEGWRNSLWSLEHDMTVCLYVCWYANRVSFTCYLNALVSQGSDKIVNDRCVIVNSMFIDLIDMCDWAVI